MWHGAPEVIPSPLCQPGGFSGEPPIAGPRQILDEGLCRIRSEARMCFAFLRHCGVRLGIARRSLARFRENLPSQVVVVRDGTFSGKLNSLISVLDSSPLWYGRQGASEARWQPREKRGQVG